MLHLGYEAVNFSANRLQVVGNLSGVQNDLSGKSPAKAGSSKTKDDDAGVPLSARSAGTLSARTWISDGDDVWSDEDDFENAVQPTLPKFLNIPPGVGSPSAGKPLIAETVVAKSPIRPPLNSSAAAKPASPISNAAGASKKEDSDDDWDSDSTAPSQKPIGRSPTNLPAAAAASQSAAAAVNQPKIGQQPASARDNWDSDSTLQSQSNRSPVKQSTGMQYAGNQSKTGQRPDALKEVRYRFN